MNSVRAGDLDFRRVLFGKIEQ